MQLVGSSQAKGSSAQGADSLRVFHGSDSLVLKKLGRVLSSRGRAQRPGLGPGMGEHQKIPSFDGAPEKLATYRDEALEYTFTLEIHRRYLAGPRLAQSLTGVARTVIRRKLSTDPQWLAHPRGAYTLIDFLEQAIEQPTLVQASQHIQKFFYQLRRKRGETMTEWVNRHSESLWEASRALKRVEKEYAVAPPVARSSSSTTSQQGDSRPSSWWDSAEPQRKSEDEVFASMSSTRMVMAARTIGPSGVGGLRDGRGEAGRLGRRMSISPHSPGRLMWLTFCLTTSVASCSCIGAD